MKNWFLKWDLNQRGIHMNKIITALLLCLPFQSFANRVIGGEAVDKAARPEIVRIKNSNGSTCTAVLVGPKTLLTAARCSQNGSKVTFDGSHGERGGILYRLDVPKFWEVGVVVLDESYPVPPATVLKSVQVGQSILMYGYGCTSAGALPTGKLHKASAPVVELKEDALITRASAAICYGDGGAPGYFLENNHLYLTGIGIAGDLDEISTFARLDIESVQTAIKTLATEKKIDVCGVTLSCEPLTVDTGSIPVPLFSHRTYAFEVKVGEPKFIDLAKLLKDPVAMSDVTWFLNQGAPNFAKIATSRREEGKKVLVFDPTVKENANYRFVLGAYNEIGVDSVIVDLQVIAE